MCWQPCKALLHCKVQVMLSSRVSLPLLHMLAGVHVSLATPHVTRDMTQLAAELTRNALHLCW